MPVVIVIGVLSIPAAVVRLERVMRPPNTGIGARNDDILSSETERPDVRCVGVSDSRLDGRRRGRLQRPFQSRPRFRERILNARVALDAGHVRPSGQRLRNLPAGLHKNCVNDIEGTMLDAAFTQPLQDRPLRGLAFVQQGVIHVASLLSLRLQGGGLAQVGLISQHNEKFRLLAIGGVIDHPWRDLFRRRVLVRRATLAGSARRGNRAERSYGSCGQE